MPDIKNKTEDVFGITRSLPMNYVERASVDQVFKSNLGRGLHLVVYGSSKQGKTSLRRNCLNEGDHIVIHCNNRWEDISSLHEAILKASGFELTSSVEKTTSGKNKIHAKAKIGLFSFGGEAGGEVESQELIKLESTPLELDPSDVNDIISALKSISFDKHIILEDFHYLPTNTQVDFSVSLKAFHENSQLSFIIIGVWLDENRLTVYNGDLTSRIFPINADKWEKNELENVIRKGEDLLNIKFSEEFTSTLLSSSSNSVYIVQEACLNMCLKANIKETQDNLTTIGDENTCMELINKVIGQSNGRFNSFLTKFAHGFQDTALEMHKWLLFTILTANNQELNKGITQAEIRKVLAKYHPKKTDLNSGNITQSLQSTLSLQVKKDIKPIILDYDETRLLLTIVDKSFLIWLQSSTINREELLHLIGIPIDEINSYLQCC